MCACGVGPSGCIAVPKQSGQLWSTSQSHSHLTLPSQTSQLLLLCLRSLPPLQVYTSSPSSCALPQSKRGSFPEEKPGQAAALFFSIRTEGPVIPPTCNNNNNTFILAMQFPSLGWEDPLEKEMTTHPSILAWEIPWTEEPGGLQPMGSQRVRHDLASEQQHQNHTGGLDAAAYRRLWKQTTMIGEQRVVDCPAVFPAVREECGEDKK